jgi:hypothetical protein
VEENKMMYKNKKAISLISIATASLLYGATFEPFPAAPTIEFGKDVPYYGEKAIDTSSEWENPFGQNAFDLRGSFLTPLNEGDTVVIKIINPLNGEVIYSSQVNSDGNYMAYMPEVTSGTKTYYVVLETDIGGVKKTYYVDFLDDGKFNYKEKEQIQWTYNSANILVPSDLNPLTLNDSTPNSFASFDLADVDKNKYIVKGNIKVPEGFSFGSIRIIAINTQNANEYVFEASSTASNTDTYPFEMKLLNDHDKYIIKIVTKDGVTGEERAMYYNYGNDYQESGDDQLVGMQNIGWIETSEDSGLWIPDTAKTSYLNITESFELFNPIDTTMYGKTDYKIAGTVILQSGVELSSKYDKMAVEVFDAKTGAFLSASTVICDSGNNCKYEVNLGSILNDIDGNGNGGYIIKFKEQISFVSKSFYYDIGDDHTINDNEILKSSNKVAILNNIPDVQYLKITSGTKENIVNIDRNNFIAIPEYKFAGSFDSLDSSVSFISLMIHDPKNKVFKFTEAYRGNDDIFRYSLDALEQGKYTLEASFTQANENNGRDYFNYVLDDDDGDYSSGVEAKSAEDVKVVPYNIDNESLADIMSRADFDWSSVEYYSRDVAMLNHDKDVQVPQLSLVPPKLYEYDLTITNLSKLSGKKLSVELYAPNNFFRAYQEITVDEDSETVNFKGLKEEEYYAKVMVDGTTFWADTTNNTLLEGVYYVGYQNDKACDDYRNFKHECDVNGVTKWKPTYDSSVLPTYTIGEGKITNSIAYPSKNKLTLNIDLADDYANKLINLSLEKISGSYEYQNFSYKADASGDVSSIELPVKPNQEYVLLARIGYKLYVVNNNSGTYEFIKYNMARSGLDYINDVKLDTSSDIALNSVSMIALNDVDFTFTNLSTDDDSNIDEWVNLVLQDSNGKSYSATNIANGTKSNTISIKVPSGDYKVKIIPSKNKAGYVDSDSMTDINFDDNSAVFTWDISSADTLSISANENISVAMFDLSKFKSISGTVVLDDSSDVESGFICATKTAGTDGKCAIVQNDGTYKIDGLAPSGDNEYLVEYWANSGEILKALKTVDDSLTAEEIKAPAKLDISGTVTDTDEAIKEVLLLEVNDSDNSWKILKSKKVKSFDNFAFTFHSIPEALSGYHYEIAVASNVVDPNTGVATYTNTNTKKVSDNSSGLATDISDDDTVTITISQ